MPSLNIMLIASPETRALDAILSSKYLNKLYTNFKYEKSVEIRFNTFQELARKCKALKIDIVLVDDEKFILQGISDVLKKNFVNCIAINAFWTQLVLSNKFTRDMMRKYGIKTPEIFKYPKEFPLVLRADGVTNIVNSMQELLIARQQIVNCSQEIADTIFLEQFIKGKEISLTSLFDGKTLITFPHEALTGVQLKEYNSKLEKMFAAENPDFIGYINSKIIISKQNLFNIGFNIDFPYLPSDYKEDLLFILISAIYQKLDEFKW